MDTKLPPVLPPECIYNAILRSLGLELVALYLPSVWSIRRLAGNETPSMEKPKVILRHSFALALARCSVHLIPTTVFAGLLWVNYNTFYIGPTFVEDAALDNVFLAIIQLAAKAQELLCLGSLSAIVLHALRKELVGDGIPLGLLGSGIWYTSLSSFWAPDFWCALRWSFTGYKKARFMVLLILAGALAAVIGPASAVLMLPRNQDLPAGGTSFSMRGSPEDHWPKTVMARSLPDFCAMSNATKYQVCPSGGYESLRPIFIALNQTNPCKWTGNNYAPQCQAMGVDNSRLWDSFLIDRPTIDGASNLFPSIMSSFQSPGYLERTVVTQPHAASVIEMQQLLKKWNDFAVVSTRRSTRQFKWTYDLETLGSTTSPFVRTRCTPAQNLSEDATHAQFPHLYWDTEYDPKFPGLDLFSVGKSASTMSISRSNSAKVRTQWVSLPQDFNDAVSGQTTTGLLIELPWRQDQSKSRITMGCTVAAAWHPVTVRARRSVAYSAWSISSAGIAGRPEHPRETAPIVFDPSWLDLLTTSPRWL